MSRRRRNSRRTRPWNSTGWDFVVGPELPRWVKRKWRYRYDSCSVRPYDKVWFFKGKTYRYAVWHETLGQGEIEPHWYRKKRWRHLNWFEKILRRLGFTVRG